MRRLLWLLLSTLLPHSSGRQSCRCLSYQPCWPSASEFTQLQSQLSKPLIKPTPPASACYPPSHPSGNCASVQDHLTDGSWRSNLPGSMQSLNFESFIFKNGTIDTCYYNTTLGVPCHQGNIPILGVEVHNVGDVQAAVKFAKQHNLKLIIKNTGHDFLGRSAGRGGFMLWMHNLKDISYDEDFLLEGDPTYQPHKAITFGAGVQWTEAYAAAKANGRVMVGGIASVGAAGGWILGGGHSPLSPKYGLGADNAIQFTVVLACGEYVTANQYRNPDLFWALRGGGGGTFGVLINVTYRTYDISPMTLASVNATFSTPEIAHKVVTEFIKIHPTLSDAGWGGYSGWSNSSLSATYLVTNVSVLEANATLSSFVNYAKSVVKEPQHFAVALYPLNSFYDFRSFFDSPGGAGGLLELTSRFISRSKAQDEPAKVAQLTLSVERASFSFVAGGAVTRADPDAVGVTPAWRDALGVLNGGSSWDEGASAAEIERLRQAALDELNNILDKVSPDSGTYMNEASLYEKDFKKSFFGSHYDRLKKIKSEYDVDDLFLVAEGVGSDDWDESLNCRLH
ncbi:hypothetical protein APHAL10511_007796 [Amanita phalloides]|nr:hypothetical protein APHAL10511_007796 [Amanita phalloides]